MTCHLWIVAVALVVVLAPRAAWAYVDPAAGSVLLQLLLGGVAGLLVAIKLYYRRVATWLGIGRRPDTESPPHGIDPEP
jgi:hypothetical protein